MLNLIRPPKQGKFLCYCKHFEDKSGYFRILGYVFDLYKAGNYAFYEYKKRRKPGWIEYDSEYGTFEVDNVAYWMPLPPVPQMEDTQ